MVKDLNRSFSILFLFLKNDQKQESPLRWWRHLVPCWPCSCVCVCVCVFCMHVIFIYMVYGVLICILSSACRLEFPSWGYNHLNWIVLCLHVLLSAVCKRTCRKSFTNHRSVSFHLKAKFDILPKKGGNSTHPHSIYLLLGMFPLLRLRGMMLTGGPCRGPSGPVGCYCT